MSSSISGAFGTTGMMQRPDPSQMASRLFSRLDTRNQGYIEKSDLESAFSSLVGASSSDGASVDDVFASFDGDSDGKITEDELSSGFRKLAEELDSQFGQMRMNGFGGMGRMGGMEPPPPQEGEDAGFTQEELAGQLEEIGSTDSRRASLISDIVANFEEADSDGDGKVSLREAMAYGKANEGESATASADASASASASQEQIMQRIMQLMRSYGGQESAAGALSVSA